MNRFRVVAGPNGSGKSTLVALLRRRYAVNFYSMLNADDIFAEVSHSLAYQPSLPVRQDDLSGYASASKYPDAIRDSFLNGDISVDNDVIRFSSMDVVNSYTIALLTNFLQAECLKSGISFSQETVFSHKSKVYAIKAARDAGYRTYLYFVANQDLSINLTRICNRVKSGGHDVPAEKVLARAGRSLENARAALPFCSRAFFFDNSGREMRFLAEYSDGGGIVFASPDMPEWAAGIICDR